jgi:hypothetical protein
VVVTHTNEVHSWYAKLLGKVRGESRGEQGQSWNVPMILLDLAHGNPVLPVPLAVGQCSFRYCGG